MVYRSTEMTDIVHIEELEDCEYSYNKKRYKEALDQVKGFIRDIIKDVQKLYIAAADYSLTENSSIISESEKVIRDLEGKIIKVQEFSNLNRYINEYRLNRIKIGRSPIDLDFFIDKMSLRVEVIGNVFSTLSRGYIDYYAGI